MLIESPIGPVKPVAGGVACEGRGAGLGLVTEVWTGAGGSSRKHRA